MIDFKNNRQEDSSASSSHERISREETLDVDVNITKAAQPFVFNCDISLNTADNYNLPA